MCQLKPRTSKGKWTPTGPFSMPSKPDMLSGSRRHVVSYFVLLCIVPLSFRYALALLGTYPYPSTGLGFLLTLMSSSPITVSISEIVLSVKLCVPLIHLDISASFFPAALAKSAWLHPFFFNNSAIRAAMENERLLCRLDSSGISSNISANNGFVYSVLFISYYVLCRRVLLRKCPLSLIKGMV